MSLNNAISSTMYHMSDRAYQLASSFIPLYTLKIPTANPKDERKTVT